MSLRGAGGWLNRPVDAPLLDLEPPLTAPFQFIQTVVGASSDASHVLVYSREVLAPGAIEGRGGLYMRNTATGEYRLVATSSDPMFSQWGQIFGGQDGTIYVAQDGQSALFATGYPVLEGVTPGPYEIYLYSWNAETGLAVESVLPASQGGAATVVGVLPGGGTNGPRDPMPRGNDGLDRMYFTDGNTGRIYVRSGQGAERDSKLVSYSRLDPAVPTPTAGTPFSVSEDGRYLLFRTSNATRLTTDTPASMGPATRWLYRYDALDESLDYVGATPTNGQVVQMSHDGGTIAFYSYFEQAGSGSTVDQAQKLFVWRESERVAARLHQRLQPPRSVPESRRERHEAAAASQRQRQVPGVRRFVGVAGRFARL